MSISVTIDGEDRTLVDWTLRVPEIGSWRAHIAIEAAPVPDGAAVVLDGTWHGTVIGSSPLGAYTSLDIVGGAGGLDVLVPETYYANASAGDVLRAIAASAGESAVADTFAGMSQWRTRGERARDEVETLARWTTGWWRVLPDGTLSLAAPTSDAGAPGKRLDSARDYRVYESASLPPLTGATIEDWTAGTVMYTRGAGRPQAAIWRLGEALRRPRAGAVGATVGGVNGSLVDVETDTGAHLMGIPLWSAAGVVPTVVPGARVTVIDLGDDPRSTIALAGAFDSLVSKLELAQGGIPDLANPATLNGRVVRYGDTIMMPSGAAAIPTPTVVTVLTPVPVSKVFA